MSEPCSTRTNASTIARQEAGTDIEALERTVERVAGLVVRAAAIADRYQALPCLDYWATRERLARINDVVFNGQRLLQRLCTR